jgi:hypothetical protein
MIQVRPDFEMHSMFNLKVNLERKTRCIRMFKHPKCFAAKIRIKLRSIVNNFGGSQRKTLSQSNPE